MHPRRIALFGTFDERAHPRVRVLREGLTDTGYTVDVVNVALDLDTAARIDLVKKPWRAPLVGFRILRAWMSLIRRFRALPIRPDAVIVGYLGVLDVHLARVLFRGPILLDQMVTLGDTVRDRNLAQRSVLVRLLDWLDRRAAKAADLILVDTEEHLDLIAPGERPKGVTVLVGAPAEWKQPGRRVESGPLRVVFFGLYTPLQGTPTIGRAIALLADTEIEFSMIGSGQDRDETRRLASTNSHVTWHDWIDPDDLPELVGLHDVCLGIFGTGPKALRVVPNKVFQGASAGCAVVTSDTDPQRSALGDAAIYVKPGDAGDLTAALTSLAGDAGALAGYRSAATAISTERFTPRSTVRPLAHALEQHLADSTRPTEQRAP